MGTHMSTLKKAANDHRYLQNVQVCRPFFERKRVSFTIFSGQQPEKIGTARLIMDEERPRISFHLKAPGYSDDQVVDLTMAVLRSFQKILPSIEDLQGRDMARWDHIVDDVITSSIADALARDVTQYAAQAA